MKTMKSLLSSLLLVTVFGLATLSGAEQSDPKLESILSLLEKDTLLDETVKKALTKDLKDPDVLNELLGGLLRSKAAGPAGNLSVLAGVLSSLNVKFKAFQTKDSTEASLGLTYSIERSLKNHALDDTVGYPMSLSFTFHAKGNIAFKKSLNPDDFLDTGASFDLFASKGGFEPLVNGDPDVWAAEVQALNLEAANFKGTPEELDASPVWQKIESMVGARLSTQYFWRASGNFSLESNQDFTKKQYAYGLLLSGVIRAWNPKSAWADFNVLDWPFATLRYLTGADPEIRPSGRALPVVLVALEQIDPQKNADRLAVDADNSKYGRWRGEIGMKTKLARISGQDVWAFGSYRVFQELSPSSAIRAAGLHRFEYWAVGVEMENGLGFTYSKGKMPFDRKEEQVFDIGYKFNFK